MDKTVRPGQACMGIYLICKDKAYAWSHTDRGWRTLLAWTIALGPGINHGHEVHEIRAIEGWVESREDVGLMSSKRPGLPAGRGAAVGLGAGAGRPPFGK